MGFFIEFATLMVILQLLCFPEYCVSSLEPKATSEQPPSKRSKTSDDSVSGTSTAVQSTDATDISTGLAGQLSRFHNPPAGLPELHMYPPVNRLAGPRLLGLHLGEMPLVAPPPNSSLAFPSANTLPLPPFGFEPYNFESMLQVSSRE